MRGPFPGARNFFFSGELVQAKAGGVVREKNIFFYYPSLPGRYPVVLLAIKATPLGATGGEKIFFSLFVSLIQRLRSETQV